MMHYKYCEQELPAGGNPRREFCNDAHRQAYWRQVHRVDQEAAQQAELEALRTQVAGKAQQIEELEAEVSRLRRGLDIEQRFLSDTAAHPFRSWLKKQPRSAFAEKLFEGDLLVPARGSRGLHEAYLRRLGCTEE